MGFDIGPRLVPVMRIGNDVLGATRPTSTGSGVENITVPLFTRHVGALSGLPFDNTVKDARGRDLGTIETVGNHISLKRW